LGGEPCRHSPPNGAGTRHPAGTGGFLPYLGATAFVVATAWYGLARFGVTVAGAPPATGSTSADLHTYYAWWVTTLAQERLYTSIAIVGFLCLAGVAAPVRDLPGDGNGFARVGAYTIRVGALLWIVGDIAQLGGHRAVGMMATHTNPIETVSSIAFTVDTVTEWFELSASTLIGAGLLAFAAVALGRPEHRAWAGYTVLVAVLLFLVAGSDVPGGGTLTDVLLVAGGLVALPAWLVWTGHLRSPL